jgi:hypothetical protein
MVRPEITKAINNGHVSVVAVAVGEMRPPGETPEKLQMVLLHGRLYKEDPPCYFVFETLADEIDDAVMMNGDGTRHFGDTPLPQREAIIKWMAGFLNWNCDVPGLYQLRYALVE